MQVNPQKCKHARGARKKRQEASSGLDVEENAAGKHQEERLSGRILRQVIVRRTGHLFLVERRVKSVFATKNDQQSARARVVEAEDSGRPCGAQEVGLVDSCVFQVENLARERGDFPVSRAGSIRRPRRRIYPRE